MVPGKSELSDLLSRLAKGDKTAQFDADIFNKTYLQVLALIRGLVERSDVFSPHKCAIPDSFGFIQDDPNIKIIYDLTDVITDGRPIYSDWKKAINSNIREGSRVLYVEHYINPDYVRDKFVRYYPNKWAVPELPKTGIYQVENYSSYWGSTFKFAYLPSDRVYTRDSFESVARTKRVSFICDINSDWVFNFDEIDISDVDFYLNSRLHRSKYFSQIKVLKAYKQFFLKEKKLEDEYVKMICTEFSKRGLEPIQGYTEEDLVRRSLQVVKDRLKWKRPVTSKDKETFTLVCRNLFSKANIAKFMRRCS